MTTNLKDGSGNEFVVVTKDVSPTQNNSVRQNWHFATKYPVEHRSGGAYQSTLKSGVMVANVSANAPIVSFRFVSPSLICLLRNLDFSLWSFTSPLFAVGILSFDAFVARTYTSEDTGGTLAALAGNVGKLRTDHQAALVHLRCSDTTALAIGTRTLDAQPFENIVAGVPSASLSNNVFFNNVELFKERDHPLVLGTNEGVIIQANVPATGTWGFNVTAVWDEVEANNF